jgi:hypothetical protein
MITLVTGRHRGRRSLRWRLVVAVMTAAVGRGYAGRHRLEASALGVPAPASPLPAASPSTQPPQADWATAVPPLVVPVAVPRAVTASPELAAAGARLALVPVAASPDPLVDTVPHPVVKLFPMPVVSAEEAVFAAEDASRDAAATAELAAGGTGHGDEYHGRHTASA